VSRIDDLVADLCPNGVPFKELGEVGTFIRGRRFTKADYVEDGLGAIHYGEIYTVYGTATLVTQSFVRPELKSSLRLARTGDLVIAATGENVKDVCKAVAWIGHDEIAIHDDCYIFRHGLEPKYVSYFFQSSAFQDQKIKFASESKVVRVSGSSMAKLRMPVPPLAVQREIVGVLDAFAELEAKLEAKLEAEREARRRQYEYYRDSLLTFTRERERERERERVRWLRMADLFFMRAGHHIPASRIADVAGAETPFPCYGGNGIRGYVSLGSHAGDHLLVGRQGALCGNVKRANGKFYATEHAVVLTPKPGVDVSWAFHMLTFMNLNQYASKSAQPGLAVGKLESIPVAVPPIDEQRRTGSALDKFDTLVNDLSLSLPAELNARRQQYDHYRDRLLTFSEAA
jgi:type I restriction enzyme, S subunit